MRVKMWLQHITQFNECKDLRQFVGCTGVCSFENSPQILRQAPGPLHVAALWLVEKDLILITEYLQYVDKARLATMWHCAEGKSYR